MTEHAFFSLQRAWARLRTTAYASACLAGASACADSAGTRTVQSIDGVERPPSTAPENPCRGAPDGQACAADRHCITGSCQFNVCGDGIAAGDEACDDGNLARADGCSPSCKLEPVRCAGGSASIPGEACSSDAGGDAAEGDTSWMCPAFVRMFWERDLPLDTSKGLYDLSVPYMYQGDSVDLRADVGDIPEVFWVARPDGDAPLSARPDVAAGLYSSERFSTPRSLESTFSCPDEPLVEGTVTYEIGYLVILPDTSPCKTQLRSFDKVQCRQRTSASAPDAAAPGLDASPAGAIDGSTDAGMIDATLGDAQLPEAGTADAGASSGFRSVACETCTLAACSDYAGLDLAGACFRGVGFDAAFAQACSSAFYCSHNASDGCADDTVLGSVGCFCGVGVDPISECSASPRNVKGRCKKEWYAATRCAEDNQVCALQNYDKLEYPSGFAHFLVACQLDLCATECAR